MKFKVGDKVVLTEKGRKDNPEDLTGVCVVTEVDDSWLPYFVEDFHGNKSWMRHGELEHAVEAPKIDLATMEYVASTLVAFSSAAINDTERLAAFSGYISGLLAGLKGDIPA